MSQTENRISYNPKFQQLLGLQNTQITFLSGNNQKKKVVHGRMSTFWVPKYTPNKYLVGIRTKVVNYFWMPMDMKKEDLKGFGTQLSNHF